MADSGSPELIVFLGNAGARYARTRHNAGWLVLERFAPHDGWQRKFKGEWMRYRSGRAAAVLLKPLTMMNLSGACVQAAARFFRVGTEQIVIVHDDSELPFGKVGMRRDGGLAGHNGLRSIADRLSSRDFWRLRIGVGRPLRGDLRSHVLSPFSPAEESVLPRILDAAAENLSAALRSGLNEAPPRNVVPDG